MAETKLRGNSIHTSGDLPKKGSKVPDFTLTKTDLSSSSLKDYLGKPFIMNVFPSLDTAVCAASVRHFNEAVQSNGTPVLCISADLPFAHNRFCTTEGLEKVTPLSVFKNPEFAKNFGLGIVDGPLQGLLARAVILVDKEGKVAYTELVPEIGQEPDYASVLALL